MGNICGSFEEVNSLKVAILENDPKEAIDLRLKLEHPGYIITGIYCAGKDAAENINETEADVIIIDLSDNEAAGSVKIAERIMLTQSIPIVFIAECFDLAARSRINFITDYSVLLKPFTGSELLNAVELVHKRFIKSVDFYQDCRKLILEINPYKVDFAKKLDWLTSRLLELAGAEDYGKAKYLLNEIRMNFSLFVNTEEPAYLPDKNFERSIRRVVEYADYLLEKIDSLDNEEIKNYISRISIYLKVLFDFNRSDNIST